MKKNVIALLLSIVMALGSIGAAPVIAAETTSVGSVPVQDEDIEDQDELINETEVDETDPVNETSFEEETDKTEVEAETIPEGLDEDEQIGEDDTDLIEEISGSNKTEEEYLPEESGIVSDDSSDTDEIIEQETDKELTEIEENAEEQNNFERILEGAEQGEELGPVTDLLNAQIGSRVIWGYTEQDNDKSNGPEEMTWIVLDHNEDEESWLLISEKIIDISLNQDQDYTIGYTYNDKEWRVKRDKNLTFDEYKTYKDYLSYIPESTEYARKAKDDYPDTYESWDGSTRVYYKSLENWWGSEYYFFDQNGAYTAENAWRYTVFGFRPVAEVVPISAMYISEMGLYKEKEQLNSKVDTLNYSAGNFYYDINSIDVQKPDTSDFDSLYMSFQTTITNRTELITTKSVDIRLPRGLSFEPDKMVRDKTFEIRFAQNDTVRSWDKVYLLYDTYYDYIKEDYDLLDETGGKLEMRAYYQAEIDGKTKEEHITICGVQPESEENCVWLLLKDEAGEWYKLSYNSSLFDCNPNKYNQNMALYSAYLANIIESGDKPAIKDRIKNNLLLMGFSHIKYSGYSSSTISNGQMEEYVCATKKVVNNNNVETIVVYAIQGSDAMGSASPNILADWLGNFAVGIQADVLNKYHANFTTCINNNYNAFNSYITSQGINISDPGVRVIVTGHSRGAAIANGVSAKLGDTSLNGRLYSYTFAAPNHLSSKAASEKNCDFIYNVINKYDAVPYVPTNYYKYGNTLVIHEGNLNSIASNHGMDKYIKGVNKGEFDDSWKNTLEPMKKASLFSDLVKTETIEMLKYAYQSVRKAPNRIVNRFHCPVNIEVLNANGESVCAIVDDNIFYDFDERVFLMIRGDEKVVTYPSGEGYSVRAIGNDTGVMDYTCVSVDENGNDSEVRVFNDLPVNTNEIVIACKENGLDLCFVDGLNKIIEPHTVYNGNERTVNVILNANIDGAGMYGGGIYAVGEQAVVACDEDVSDKEFSGWYDKQGTCVSESAEYSFIVSEDVELKAVYWNKEKTPISEAWVYYEYYQDVVTYTGYEIEPKPVVDLNGSILTPGIDYTVTYSNNINAGKAIVTITGIGNYNSVITDSFRIYASSLSAATVSGLSKETYTGTAITQNLTLKLGSTTLVAGVDYELKYYDNTNVGTATVLISGIGNYNGSIFKTFEIIPKPITPTILLSETSFVYNGKSQEPDIIIRDGEREISKSNYVVTRPINSCEKGIYKITVNLQNNYSGSGETSYVIAPKPIIPTIKLSNESYVYNGTEQKPDITVIYNGEMLLTNEYTVEWPSGCSDVGTYHINVILKGNYSGEGDTNYIITPKQVTPDIVLSETSFIYDGEEHKPEIKVMNGKIELLASDYTVEWPPKSKDVGSYQITVTLKGNYKGSNIAGYKITTKDNKPIITLSNKAFVYNGKEQKPEITVKIDNQVLSSSDYSVVWPTGCINAGTYNVKINLKGNLSGTANDSFKILPAASSKVTCTNVASGIKVGWEKVAGATSYYVYRDNKQIFKTSALAVTDKEVKYNSGTKYVYKVVATTKNVGDSPKARTATMYRLMPVGIKSLTNPSAGKMTVTYDKANGSSGYVVRYGLKSDMSDAKVITVSGASTTSRTFSSMQKGKTYYVQVRTYKIDNGVRYYSGYCTTKTITIKK